MKEFRPILGLALCFVLVAGAAGCFQVQGVKMSVARAYTTYYIQEDDVTHGAGTDHVWLRVELSIEDADADDPDQIYETMRGWRESLKVIDEYGSAQTPYTIEHWRGGGATEAVLVTCRVSAQAHSFVLRWPEGSTMDVVPTEHF